MNIEQQTLFPEAGRGAEVEVFFPKGIKPDEFSFSKALEIELNKEFSQHGLEIEISCGGYLAYVKHPYSKSSVWTVPLTSVPIPIGIDTSLERGIINHIWKSIKPEIQRQHKALMEKRERRKQ